MTEEELILTHILQCSRSELYLKKPQLTDQQQQQFNNFIARRHNKEPLQYILGVANFLGLDFKVNPNVLIPRPETEFLVEKAIENIKEYLSSPNVLVGDPGSRFPIVTFGNDSIIKILDIGTGSGCIAITLAKHFPNVFVTAIDVSPEALQLAQENAKIHEINNVEFIQADMAYFKTLKKFDLVISNPPYISKSQMANLPVDVQCEPQLALEAGEDGLDFYRVIIKMIPGLITRGACLMMEFGDGQALALKSLVLDSQLFSNIQIYQDLTGKDRFICAQ